MIIIKSLYYLSPDLSKKDPFTAIKSIEYLKEKLNAINDKHFVFKLVDVGKLERNIRNYISKRNLDDEINIIINPNDINQQYKQADIFISTSLYEGTSNSIMEAMSHKLPVIATNVGDNHLLIENRKNGYLSEIRDYNYIGRKLFELINSFEKGKKFGDNGYDLIRKNYSKERFTKDILN